eukprot:COSAG01_NODE_8991_length_2589_cov_8.795181_2_plen_96_part_00
MARVRVEIMGSHKWGTAGKSQAGHMMIEPMISITDPCDRRARAQGYTMPWVPDDDKALAASGGGESARGAAHLLADCGWLRFPYVQYRFLFISIA